MSKTVRLTLFIIVLLLSSPKFSYLDAYFSHLTTTNGLSQDKIICLLRDQTGFLWIGTETGLNRYDGKNIKIYKHDPDNPNSISNSFAQALLEDADGVLWIATYGGGLNKFDRITETFTHYQYDPNNSQGISSDYLLSIYEDQLNYLWIGTQGAGINQFNKGTETFTCYINDPLNPHSISNNITRIFLEDKAGTLWIGTDGGGLNKFDRQTGNFTHYRHDPDNQNSLSHDYVLSIVEEPAGVLWLGTHRGGLNKFEIQSEKFTRFFHDPKNTNSLSYNGIETLFKSPLENGIIWIGTIAGGLNKFNVLNNIFDVYKHDDHNPHSLSQNIIKSVYEDKMGLVWVGTEGKGLDKFVKVKERIKYYQNEPDNPNSLGGNQVTSIFEDKYGIFWIGTSNGGLTKFEKDLNKFTRFQHDPQKMYSISHNSVFKIAEDSLGVLWIGTSYGLNKFDRHTNKFYGFYHHPKDPSSLSHNLVLNVHIDKRNNIWIGTYGGGLDVIRTINENISKVKFDHYKYNPSDNGSISNDFIWTIFEDKAGVLWIGTQDGLNKLTGEKDKFVRFKHDPKDPNSLSCNFVVSIFEDSNGILWIGTEGGGLNKFNPESGKFSCFQEKDGLPSDNIYGILEDTRGNLWLSTKRGISKFNPNPTIEAGKPIIPGFHNYDDTDGFNFKDYIHWAYLLSSTGEMFFGGTQGLNSFYPDSIEDNRELPKVVLSDFQVMNQYYNLDTSIAIIRNITLPYNKNFIAFQFVALDLTAPEKNQYAYKLDGLNKDWVFVGNHNYANYTDVKSGEYTFKVKASNNDGIWNEEGTSIRITILPPWWRSHLAYALYVVLIVTAMVLAWRFQLNRLRLKHQLELEHLEATKLQEVDHLKSRFFANISHEFRTPLTLILGPLQKWLPILRNQDLKQDLKLMQRNANHLYRLINQLLDLSKLESGSMVLQAREENIVQLLRGYVQSFESQAKLKKIVLAFSAEPESIRLYVDRDKIEQIIYNLLSNAFKFTPAGGRIAVVVHNPPVSPLPSGSASLTGMHKGGNKGGSGEYIEISVSDTGRGIPPDKLERIFDRFYQVDDSSVRDHEGSGIGLALTKELVELHHGKITVESVLGKGTTFTIWLPLGREHLQEKEIITTAILDTSQHFVESVSEPKISGGQKLRTRKKLPLILVVEDNSDVRRYIRGHLEPTFAILEAADGKEGLQTAIEKIPDLIISDVMMPEMDGFEFCKKVKTDQRTSHIPVILLTARAASQDRIDGLETGADDYLIKPFDARELQVRVKNLITQREKLRIHYMQTLKLESGKLKVISADEAFLNKSILIADKHLSDLEYNIEKFAREIGFSYSQLVRKLESITGLSPSLFLRSRRLLHARQLLDQRAGNVAQVAYQCGFNNLSYFSRSFKEQFGQLPSEYLKSRNVPLDSAAN